MSDLQESRYKIKPVGSQLGSDAGRAFSVTGRGAVLADGKPLCSAVTPKRRNLPRACRQTVPGLLYAGLVALTGCATSAELESLRAEVARANAVAARAEATVSKTQRQLAALKASSQAPESPPEPSAPPVTIAPQANGYKWGRLRQD